MFRAFVFTLISAAAVLAEHAVYKDKPFIEFFRRTNGIVACDGGFTVPLSDGRVLWLFGDSYVDCYREGTVPCLFQVRNAAMVHRKDDLASVRALVGKGPGARSLFKNSTNSETWFWPVAGFQHERNVYVYLSGLKRAGSGPLGFASAGQDYWGKMDQLDLSVTDYLPLPNFNGIDFGTGIVYEPGSEFVYAFGQKRKKLSLSVYLARFRARQPETDWSFWDGKTWSDNVGHASAIATQDATSISICKVKGKYLLTSSQFSVACDQGKEIYVAVSDNATGPFSARKKIFTVDDTREGHHPFFYLPVAHPAFINEKDELLITYCINGYEPCLRNCNGGRMDPDIYRPRALRVSLDLILK